MTRGELDANLHEAAAEVYASFTPLRDYVNHRHADDAEVHCRLTIFAEEAQPPA